MHSSVLLVYVNHHLGVRMYAHSQVIKTRTDNKRFYVLLIHACKAVPEA